LKRVNIAPFLLSVRCANMLKEDSKVYNILVAFYFTRLTPMTDGLADAGLGESGMSRELATAPNIFLGSPLDDLEVGKIGKYGVASKYHIQSSISNSLPGTSFRNLLHDTTSYLCSSTSRVATLEKLARGKAYRRSHRSIE
jgi:hypothetical protein